MSKLLVPLLDFGVPCWRKDSLKFPSFFPKFHVKNNRRALSLTAGKQEKWKSETNDKEKKNTKNQFSKITPNLIYVYNPWRYLVMKWNMLKLRLLWDRNFSEKQFIRGSKQAAIVLTDIIRDQEIEKICKYTTEFGCSQITRDMLLSRNDSRLQLVKFETEHLRRAIPLKVSLLINRGRRYCYIDMLFVGLRNSKDFARSDEAIEVRDALRKLDLDSKAPIEVLNVPHRVLFTEILIRFRRDYTLNEDNEQVEDQDWNVSFYKILKFDVLGYDPRF